MERSITDNASSGQGNTGVKPCGTQAPASGKNTLAKGKQPPGQPNAGRVLTKGTIEGGSSPGTSDTGTAPLTAGHNVGVGETLAILQGPGRDTEKKYYVYDHPQETKSV